MGTPVDNWPSWLDRHRYAIGGVLLLVVFMLYGWLVLTAATRKLSGPETACMAIIGVVVSGALGAVFGIPFTKRRSKIASQLRRAYGICQSLRSIQKDVGDAALRMKERSGLDARVTGEFWEELAFNFENSLRGPISEAERIVEDWGELDLAERGRIHAEENKKRSEIESLYRELETAKSLEDDLESVGADTSDTPSVVETLEQRIRFLEGQLPQFGPGSAKEFLRRGKYEEAVKVYDELLKRNPESHTVYIGRARARHLVGDKSGAIEDLEHARLLNPEDPAIQRMTELMSSGIPLFEVGSEAKAASDRGYSALREGDAGTAMRHFKEAEVLGWSKPYSKYNKALAACLNGDTLLATQFLKDMRLDQGSYMAVNVAALGEICRLLMEGSGEAQLTDISARLKESRNKFHFTHSPLRSLQLGLSRFPHTLQRARPVFEFLQKGEAG